MFNDAHQDCIILIYSVCPSLKM